MSRSYYDLNGNREKATREWYSDPDAKTGLVELKSETEYDENDRVRFSWDERGNKTETVYDSLGRVARTIDPRGVVTETPTYNSGGLAVESRSPGGTLTRTVYDTQGRTVVSTTRSGPTRPATAAPGRCTTPPAGWSAPSGWTG